MSEGIIWKSFEEWRSDAQARWMAGGLNYMISDAWNARNAEVAALTTAKEKAEAAIVEMRGKYIEALDQWADLDDEHRTDLASEVVADIPLPNPGAAILDRLAAAEKLASFARHNKSCAKEVVTHTPCDCGYEVAFNAPAKEPTP